MRRVNLELVDQLFFVFGDRALRLAVDVDTDEVAATSVLIADARDLEEIDLVAEGWPPVLGANMSWGWTTTNHQGYADGILLSFEQGVMPQVVVVGAASQLEIGFVSKLTA